MNYKNHELTRNIRKDVSEWLAVFDDDVERCLAQGWIIEQMQHHVQLLAQSRVASAKQLRSQGMSIRGIARLLGLSHSRVEQITAK